MRDRLKGGMFRRVAACVAASIFAFSTAAEAQAPPTSAAPEQPPEPIVFEAGPRLGFAYRIGGGSSFSVTDRAGAVFGLAVGISPSSRYTVGLAYEHSALGEERGSGDAGDVVLSRSLDALWASVRLAIFRTDSFAVNLTLGPGLAWQHVDASVIVLGDGTARPDTFQCTETGGPGLGLRAGLGVEGRVGDHFLLSLDGLFDNLRLASDPLGSCAQGAGSVTLFGARFSVAYRGDVSRYTR